MELRRVVVAVLVVVALVSTCTTVLVQVHTSG